MAHWPIAFAQESETSLSLAAYRELVAEASRTLTPADAVAEQQLPFLSEDFAAIEVVRYPSGELVNVQPLLGSIDAGANGRSALSLSDALTRLRLVEDQLAGANNDRTEERITRLAGILARPEFRASETIWNRIWRWVRNLVRYLLPEQVTNSGGIPGLSSLAQIVGWGAALLGLVLLALLLSYWLQGLLRNFVKETSTHGQRTSTESALTAEAARQQAQEAAGAGKYRQAVRRLYLSALLLLEEHGLIVHDRSLTNSEVLSTVDRDSPIHARLQPVVEAFDAVWYGVHEPDMATYVAYERDVDSLVEIAVGEVSAGVRDGRETYG